MRPFVPALAVALALSGCASAPPMPSAQGFGLRVLHVNDHHSRIAPDPGQSLRLDGEEVQLSFGGFPRVVAKLQALRGDDTLVLHAGDAVAGDLYFTLFQGQADADLMNQACFDAFVLGNHEFDAGDAGLRRFLDHLASPAWDCETPVLSANVRPKVGASPLALRRSDEQVRPSVVVERGGRRIGIVGITAVDKTISSSAPGPGIVFDDETRSAQREIDALRADGVDVVVLLTHIGYRNDIALAHALSGVDVIVGGDSHSLLGDALREYGLSVDGPYPTVVPNADGDPVCVVQAWQYSWVVGELEVDFDADGRVRRCGGRPHLLLGDDFRQSGAPVDDARRARLLRSIAAAPELSIVTPDPAAQQVLDFYTGKVQEFAGEVLGQVPERLCLRRAPGSHDRSRDGTPGCAEATDAQGGHIQNLVAHAFLDQARRYGGADIALQNGGGVRDGVSAGAFTVGTAYTVLPFKNTLVRLTMTGAELKQALEGAIEFFLGNLGANTGSYPYAAGLRWRVDLTRTREQGRLVDMEVLRDGAWQPLDPAATYRIVTSDYLASGKDGYDDLALIPAERREDTFFDYAQALIDYVRAGRPLSRPPPETVSTQHFRDLDGKTYAP
jgi:5'-nucleotidase/UDP-sugar diphosphatase